MLIVGLAPHMAALAIGIAMLVALVKVHWGGGFMGTHLLQVILAACLALFIAGGGALSVQRSSPREPMGQ